VPEKHAYTIGNRRLANGQWGELTGVEVPLGNGSIGVSEYSELLYVDQDRLYNPATGDVLSRTKKDKAAGEAKHYFSKETGTYVTVWKVQGVDEET